MLLLVSAAILLLVCVLTVVVVLRRGGQAGEDLLASQMRTISDPQPVAMDTSLWRDDALPDHGGSVDDATWRRIGELAVAGRRVQAIELLRTTTGCRLTEAKAVVDQLSLGDGRRPVRRPPDRDWAP